MNALAMTRDIAICVDCASCYQKKADQSLEAYEAHCAWLFCDELFDAQVIARKEEVRK